MSAGPWTDVAARGTDPMMLRAAVGRLLGPRGAPMTCVRDANALCDRTDSVRGLIGELVGEPRGALAAAVDDVATRWREAGVRAALVGDPAFPARLGEGWPTTGGPMLLAWRGPAVERPNGLPTAPSVAIVGSRRASSYGSGIASWLAASAAEAGCVVVSGGAVGIDAAAHRACIDADGTTVVVLGCGHDVAYPRAHARAGGLFDRVLDAGGWIVGELPPLARPVPANVLARNRLVAGLADVVVVVEGGRTSGALRTAEVAAERGRPVLAVPGDVRAPGSAAPHRLLADGAAPCTGPEDLLEVLDTERGTPTGDRAADAAVSSLPEAVREELARRWPRAVSVTELVATTGLGAGALLAALTRAQVAGETAEDAEGVRLRRAPSSRPGRGSR